MLRSTSYSTCLITSLNNNTENDFDICLLSEYYGRENKPTTDIPNFKPSGGTPKRATRFQVQNYEPSTSVVMPVAVVDSHSRGTTPGVGFI